MLYSDPSGEIRKEAPQVSFLDHGFLFGDSLYEVVRTYDRRIMGWAEHLARMIAGGKRVGIDIAALAPELESRGLALLKALDKPNAALRLIVTRGIGKLHIDTRSCEKPLIYMAAWELELANLHNPIRLWVPEIRRNSRYCIDPSIKSGNYLNSVLALREAVQNGYDDAVFLNLENHVTELTTSNIGWIKNGKVYTPHVDTGILHGVTRGILLQVEAVHQGHYSVEDLLSADEVFALSTFKEICPVTEIESFDGKKSTYKNHHITRELHKKVQELIRKKLSDGSLVY
jgi:branched-chain amino acid aminotransferase